MKVTIARLYDRFDDASQCVRDLEAAGVPHADVSLIANNSANELSHHVRDTRDVTDHDKAGAAAKGASVGAIAGGGAGLLAGLGLLAIPGLGPVVAAGWLAATAVGAIGGAAAGGATGGIIAALTESGVSENHAHVYAEGVRRGGTLVTARVEEARSAAVEKAMHRASAVDPDQRREDYGKSGWKEFDARAEPFVATPQSGAQRPTV
jgi:hypothetical protein